MSRGFVEAVGLVGLATSVAFMVSVASKGEVVAGVMFAVCGMIYIAGGALNPISRLIAKVRRF